MNQSYVKINKLFLLALVALYLNGCSSGGGGGSAPSGANPVNKPQNAGEALALLSNQHRAAFEKWMSQIIKSCSASEAFGLETNSKDSHFAGLDGAAVIVANKNSMIYSDSNQFSILTDYSSFSGESKSKVEHTEDINGRNYTVSAETTRQGSFCAVYLYGQKVYETVIAKSFTVGAGYDVQKALGSSTNVVREQSIGSGNYSEVYETGIFSVLSEAFKPTASSVDLIAQKLGLNKDEKNQYLKLSSQSQMNYSIKPENDSQAIWSDSFLGTMIFKSGQWAEIVKAGKPLALEARSGVPSFQFGLIKNTADEGTMKFSIQTKVSTTSTSALKFDLQAIRFIGNVAEDLNEATACSDRRSEVYFSNRSSKISIEPTVDKLFSPCRQIYKDIYNVSFKNGMFKRIIASVFSGVQASAQTRYGQWDQVLSELAYKSLQSSTDILQDLDPSHQTFIIPAISDYFRSIKSNIDQSKNLNIIADSFYQVGLRWAFAGLRVEDIKIGQIAQSLDNVVDTFQQSSKNLLVALSYQPNNYASQLNFASKIDSTYKAEAVRVLYLSQELNYSEFEKNVFNQILQNMTTVDELAQWASQLTAIKVEINKYIGLSPVKGALVGLSIKWLRNGEAQIQDLSYIFEGINNAMDPFAESTDQLIKDLGQSLSSHKQDIDFARGLTAEYKQLSKDILTNARLCDYESWGIEFFKTILQKRPSIEQLRTWNNMWSAMYLFIQREKSKVGPSSGAMPEWNRKEILEKAIQETWSNQEFTALEAIAAIAVVKNTCGTYKDASSQAKCAGLSLFSKKQKMFFDPSFNSRYVQLANIFNGFFSKMSDSSYMTYKWTMVDNFFGSWEPIWSNCDATSFTEKSSLLSRQMNEYLSTSDQFKKWELERQVKDTLQNCN